MWQNTTKIWNRNPKWNTKIIITQPKLNAYRWKLLGLPKHKENWTSITWKKKQIFTHLDQIWYIHTPKFDFRTSILRKRKMIKKNSMKTWKSRTWMKCWRRILLCTELMKTDTKWGANWWYRRKTRSFNRQVKRQKYPWQQWNRHVEQAFPNIREI